MPRYFAKVVANKHLRRFATGLVTNREVMGIAIRALTKLSPAGETRGMIKIHSYSSYATIASKSRDSAAGRAALMSISAVNTMRFMVFPKPVPIDVSNIRWVGLRGSKEIAGRLLCDVERLLDRAEKSENIKDSVNMLRGGLSGIIEERALRDLIEEYIHSRISRGTSVRFTVELLAWKQRLLEMYIAEKIHSRVAAFPRNPRRMVEERGLSGADSIKRHFDGLLEEVERAVDADLLKAFREYVASLYFQKYLYPIAIVPLIEVPTWLVMNKMGLMNEDEINARLRYKTYFPDNEDVERAREVYGALLKFTDPDEIVGVANEALNPTLDELVKAIDEAVRERDPNRFADYFMERFSGVLHERSRPDRVRRKGSTFPFWEIVKVLGVQSEEISDLIEVVCDILSRDRRLLEEYYLKKIAGEYGHVGIVISLKVGTEVIGPVFIDRWSGSICEEGLKNSSSNGTRVDTFSCGEIGTVECLVGLVPTAMRPYVILREWLMTHGVSKALQLFLQAQIGEPKMDVERCKACIESAQGFEYRGLTGYAEASARDVSNIVVGAGFMVACLGPIFRPHGIYLY